MGCLFTAIYLGVCHCQAHPLPRNTKNETWGAAGKPGSLEKGCPTEIRLMRDFRGEL